MLVNFESTLEYYDDPAISLSAKNILFAAHIISILETNKDTVNILLENLLYRVNQAWKSKSGPLIIFEI